MVHLLSQANSLKHRKNKVVLKPKPRNPKKRKNQKANPEEVLQQLLKAQVNHYQMLSSKIVASKESHLMTSFLGK